MLQPSKDIRGMLRETYFYTGGAVGILSALCPACGFEHSFRVDLEGHGKWVEPNGPWSFNGDYDKPTFQPSMLANQDQIQDHHPICHSFLTAGVWHFLADCSHGMAGQYVPMIPPEPNASFQRRHGWHLYPWTDDEGKPIQST